MAEASSLIPASVLRNLTDKQYEKRKKAAVTIQDIVGKLAYEQEVKKILAVINILATEFTDDPRPDRRKGGLTGLAAVAVGLKEKAPAYLEEIVPPVLNHISDEDSTVRYIASETLYNVAKAVRGRIIIYFDKIFDALCKLSDDSDTIVQSGAHLLDNLLKDIATESDQFSLEEFVPLLRERMDIINPHVRQFLLGWITVLNNVPDMDMLCFLPDYLDGLFNMLSDSSPEVRQQAHCALSEFLQEIKNTPTSDYGRMAKVLVQRSGSPDDYTRLTSFTWMNEFVKHGADHLIPCYSDILGAVLPCISDKEKEIREIARETNKELRAIIASPAEGVNIGAVLTIARSGLTSQASTTRVAALQWIATLLDRHWNEVISFLNDIFSSLLAALSDPSDEVVILVLEVHACLAEDSQNLGHLIDHLVQTFRNDHALLEKRGALIVRRLCVRLDAEQVYREFSSKIEREDDLDFASNMVQALNFTLLTSSELVELRILLKQSLVESSSMDLFVSLYSPWCHSPVATISLCLLAQAYNHASSVIQLLEEEDITAKFSEQLGKLVYLLETPVFASLRLQLVEPDKHVWLLKTLYGLLMLLPQQSAAFKIFRTRLKTVPSYIFNNEQLKHPCNQVSEITDDSGDQVDANVYDKINFPSKLQQFQQTLRRHRFSLQSQKSASSSKSQHTGP
ncbi:protein VAC14 homolog [Musa acuminata AAA Group]|uniref:protein VAC14 homolog n=1 Tax=Musa acuminata AAA Group TaxID=214697 RepID=UPI0031CF5E29